MNFFTTAGVFIRWGPDTKQCCSRDRLRWLLFLETVISDQLAIESLSPWSNRVRVMYTLDLLLLPLFYEIPFVKAPVGDLPPALPGSQLPGFLSFAWGVLKAISFPAKITMVAAISTSTQTVAAISTSTQNGCRHLYIYSKCLPPSLHLLKTVAAISTSTQNSCRHLYIYSKQLPPSLHILKTVAAISTSTQNK